MTQLFSRMGTNQRLALLAIVLGLLAVFARPMPGGTVRLNAQDLAAGLQRGGTMNAPELADWIVKGVVDFRVLDVRDEAAFASYHIPGAENVPFASLADSGVGHNEKVIVYADDEMRTAEAWFVLKALGFKDVRALAGGLAGWKGQAASPSPGAPAISPKVDVPSLAGQGAMKPPAKKKKEGC